MLTFLRLESYSSFSGLKCLIIFKCSESTTLRNTHTHTHVLFSIEDWDAKVRSQEIPGVTGKFGFGGKNEAGQRLIEFCKENTLVIASTFYQNTRDDSTHGHHQMVSTKTRLIIFFVAKEGEALYS